MMEALEEDPYAAYLDSDLYAMQQEDLEGSFQGIGARVTTHEGNVIIVAPLPGTPAERAGIQPGDVIVSVDDQSTRGMNLYEVIVLIRGPQDTSVSLGIAREGELEPLTITVVRDIIDVPSVTLEMLTEGVAHLNIEEFSQDTDDELTEALDEMKRQDARGILLDLRNNPGGILTAVVEVASHFLEIGLVLYEVNSDGDRKDWPVERVREQIDLPMVVLVNRFSASGAEVLAGALKDHKRAVVVGEKTFGKGSVNNLRSLSDGSGIYFSVAHWYTPGGNLIEGEGLEPDFPIASPSPEEETDLQMEKALELLKKQMESS
jgi:carboxyl-terminal processing protease